MDWFVYDNGLRHERVKEWKYAMTIYLVLMEPNLLFNRELLVANDFRVKVYQKQFLVTESPFQNDKKCFLFQLQSCFRP